jgi:hypothetical protein
MDAERLAKLGSLDVLEAAQLLAEDLAVEKEQCAEGLVLGRGADLAGRGNDGLSHAIEKPRARRFGRVDGEHCDAGLTTGRLTTGAAGADLLAAEETLPLVQKGARGSPIVQSLAPPE